MAGYDLIESGRSPADKKRLLKNRKGQTKNGKKPITKKPAAKKYNVGVSKGGVSFNTAFKHFRGKGNKTFTWNGEKFTTELAKAKKSSVAARGRGSANTSTRKLSSAAERRQRDVITRREREDAAAKKRRSEKTRKERIKKFSDSKVTDAKKTSLRSKQIESAISSNRKRKSRQGPKPASKTYTGAMMPKREDMPSGYLGKFIASRRRPGR